ncbi:hypothetical protein LF1_26970 [Rubripirellula obstinata]|uniref:Putative restriction endonuclease domain-containing protein n=1 Tax=Rubripirellula obstinata TaxID=406547 RepID=A0A5B1CG37_9BACT|nr:Uma2 family endonuclease [Rubripirellula obstinata]KAA1260158.1 hypothetical protein LF1_26970 [Rubripirellula obstinata]
MNPSVSTSLADRLTDLGNVPLDRVRCDPPPGKATVEDVHRLRQLEGKLYELIDNTLVEKAMGWQESMLAGLILHWLHDYLEGHPLGLATGADGMTRLFGDTVRGPDVAFVSWARLPDGRVPEQPIPDMVPDFVVEVLSVSNTRGEMSRKRREYFHAGVQLAWMVDPRGRSVAVFESAEQFTILNESDVLDGGKVLPGWKVSLAELFAALDRKAP